ncbi:cytochrome c oxidase subunit NDUFA4-like [Uranotaenia lowii]|uniref:cytochrome c oxidase subunit NDUFA4-like n=1 Tax=Uranotaenia lowii TaxID=190385 RepID=UPI00247A08EC|nr:cytochrome c oxidase subunit NDUFA4-like [Uranotaenia lowii]
MRGWGLNAFKEPLTWPLYALCIGDLIWVSSMSMRCLFKNPDVCLDHKNNPEPWQAYRNKAYRLIPNKYDYSQPHPAPIIANGKVIEPKKK